MRTNDCTGIGLVSDIQRFSVHDGPGIRTVVFLKGCPLRCRWCQNPEARSKEKLIMQQNERCIGCGACMRTCKTRCIQMSNSGPVTDRRRCTGCGACASACMTGARKLVGREYSVRDIVPVLLRDRAFYKNSGGGVTLSGGDPVASIDFASDLLSALHGEGIHTAIETCGYCEADEFEKLVRDVDLILYDIKHTDSNLHRQYTGCPNERILLNVHIPKRMGKDLIVRVPLIPGFNDGEENLRRTARIALEAGASEVHLLPFHQYGESKWHNVGYVYSMTGKSEMTVESAELAAQIMAHEGIQVCIGGSGN